MGAESLGRLSGREEPSMKESAKVPGRNAGAGSQRGCVDKCGKFVGDFLASRS